MPPLMIRCPETKQHISTGFSMDAQTFQTATLTSNSIQCPKCGKMHSWDKADAFLSQS